MSKHPKKPNKPVIVVEEEKKDGVFDSMLEGGLEAGTAVFLAESVHFVAEALGHPMVPAVRLFSDVAAPALARALTTAVKNVVSRVKDRKEQYKVHYVGSDQVDALIDPHSGKLKLRNVDQKLLTDLSSEGTGAMKRALPEKTQQVAQGKPETDELCLRGVKQKMLAGGASNLAHAEGTAAMAAAAGEPPKVHVGAPQPPVRSTNHGKPKHH